MRIYDKIFTLNSIDEELGRLRIKEGLDFVIIGYHQSIGGGQGIKK